MPLSHSELVREFHQAFGHPIAEGPTTPDDEVRALRCRLIVEEALEFVQASGFSISVNGTPIEEARLRMAPSHDPDLPEVADALADLSYVTIGAALVYGFPFDKCFREVHRSNMSKLGDDGKPVYRADGKVLKGPNFTPPDLTSILMLETLKARP